MVRLIAFLGVFIVGLYFIGVDILNYHLGAQPFTVTVLVPAASGLYREQASTIAASSWAR